MKNKIALFTWCYTNGPVNYGQILQCYSLQRVCTELGYEVNVLKYRKLQNNENIDDIPYKGAGRDAYEYAFKNKNIQSQLSKQVIRVNEFINENVKMTKQCYCIEDVLEEIDDSDILIVGSDQLWNPQWLDTIYLLPFKEDKKRISYATSGIFFDDEQAKGIADMIKHFDYLSVREPISKIILNRYIERDIFCALDPVFLLDSKNWDEIGGKEICDEAYVFAFFIGLIEPQKHLIRQVAQKYDVNKVIYIKMAASEEIFNDLSIMEGIEDAGPKEFISLIKHAVAVCTDSYHAFVLSVIYHKNFHLMNRAYVPLNEVSNERWDSVMRKLGIENRYSNSRSEIMNLSQIDYEKVENQLNYLREESREWLIKALG